MLKNLLYLYDGLSKVFFIPTLIFVYILTVRSETTQGLLESAKSDRASVQIKLDSAIKDVASRDAINLILKTRTDALTAALDGAKTELANTDARVITKIVRVKEQRPADFTSSKCEDKVDYYFSKLGERNENP